MLNRRRFLQGASGMGVALGLGPGFWSRAFAAPAQPGTSPYGPLSDTPDENGVLLPAGFTSRVIANSMQPVPGTTYVWHMFPDGGACVPTDDDGWIYVSNSENPPPADFPVITDLMARVGEIVATNAPALLPLPGNGGVSAIRFDAAGNVVDAYAILAGSLSNCAGGLTPWGTWLSCEEFEDDDAQEYAAGRVWECDPFGTAAVLRPSLGILKHEAAACDPVREVIYLSEDLTDGLFYRYTPLPGTWGSGAALDGGLLEAMAVAGDHSVSWLPVPDADAPTGPLRATVPGATPFDGGEGVVFDSDCVYLTTKNDDRVWKYDIVANTMTVLYDAAEFPDPVLNGVDNIIASSTHDLYVAEDGGNMEVCIITPDLVVAPVVRLTGDQHGFENDTPLPTVSEITGLAFSPDGNRLYLNSERGNGFGDQGPGPGILYEITGPFRGGTLAAAQQTTTTTSTSAPLVPAATGSLPATGTDAVNLTTGAAAAAAAAAALTALRRRATP